MDILPTYLWFALDCDVSDDVGAVTNLVHAGVGTRARPFGRNKRGRPWSLTTPDH